MKISVSWINELLSSELSADTISDLLTASGLEVEDNTPFFQIQGGLEHVVLGKVLQVVPHPNADRLKICTVDVGNQEQKQIVCGATNVAVNQTVVVALPGATLHPVQGEPLHIKKSKIRGESSEGMICAEDELGLGNGHEGILVVQEEFLPGTPAAKFFKLETDQILTINITPNRADGASHVGACRDIVAKLFTQGKSLNMPDFPRAFHPLSGLGKGISITIEDETGCGRYTGITLNGVQVGPSPLWLTNRLKALGLKPQNSVVDVTNFVMFLLGHPLHAFDADAIEGARIVVRKAKQGETLCTLDQVQRELHPEDLVIADAEKAICLAGVFGGLESGIQPHTKRIFLESAWFHPTGIRKTAKRHGIHTDASFRFERGTDPSITQTALRVAARLIMEIAQGSPEGDEVDETTKGLPAPRFVPFEMDYLNRLAGIEVPDNEAAEILRLLGFEGEMERHSTWRLKVPDYRPDVHRPADVAEEILRIYGFDRIPVEGIMDIRLNRNQSNARDLLKESVGNWLAARGFHEAVHLSMLPLDMAEKAYPELSQKIIALQNPLSKDLAVMRPGLLPGLLQSAANNIHHRNLNFRLFEFGKSYLKSENGQFLETDALALLACGKYGAEHWLNGDYEADIYEIKGWVNGLFRFVGIHDLLWSESTNFPWNGMGLEIRTKKDGKMLAHLGWVSPELCSLLGMKAPLYYAEIHWELFGKLAGKSNIAFQAIPRFPSMRRDLALLVPKDIRFEQVENLVQKHGSNRLESWQLFDVYAGKGVPEGFVSMALGLVFRDPQRTLRDEETEQMTQKLLRELNQRLGVELRS